ncbi:MAG: hypothetical protein WCC08_06455 [Terrimicrobiaceae bacterium]
MPSARFEKDRLLLLNISRVPHCVGKHDPRSWILWFGFHKIYGNRDSLLPILCCYAHILFFCPHPGELLSYPLKFLFYVTRINKFVTATEFGRFIALRI